VFKWALVLLFVLGVSSCASESITQKEGKEDDSSAPQASVIQRPSVKSESLSTASPVAATLPAPIAAPRAVDASVADSTWDGSPESVLKSRNHPIVGEAGMVVSDDETASRWGVEILKQGGNAMDAAVATAFALSVTRPHFGSLGGGGFMVYCPKVPEGASKGPSCTTIDYREQAPSQASRDMYLKEGKADTQLSQQGAKASGVPGVTAGLLYALEKYGSFSRAKILKRPIELALNGVALTPYGEATARENWSYFNDGLKRIVGCGKETLAPCNSGTRIVQADLAKVLSEIVKEGSSGFYEGWVAEKISSEMTKAGGFLTFQDLASYTPKERAPLSFQWNGLEIVTMPPPSSGGAILEQLLAYEERAYATKKFKYTSSLELHALTHAMKLAFLDRARFFGDPDFVKVDLDRLESPEYLTQRWETFDPAQAVPVLDPTPEPLDTPHTTHFSVVDKLGNAVSVTTTINEDYGSGFVPEGTGVVMNNEMDDFSSQPGVPNVFRLVGSEANSIAPKKRPLSTMSPTIVRDLNGQVRIVTGAAGGPTIVTSVFEILENRYRFKMSLPDAVAAPRFHHQWKPDVLKLERFGFSPETINALKSLGYSVEEVSGLAKTHSLERFPNQRVWGAPDPRGEGAAIAE